MKMNMSHPKSIFGWDIFATINYKLADEVIKYSQKQRVANEGEGEGDQEVEIADEILIELKKANYFSKKKGKVMFMLTANKKFEKIERKRKK
jgi:nitric oxide synthase oxygenase domain/subunit